MTEIISSFNEFYQAGSDEVTLRNEDLTARNAGSVVDTQLGAASAIADEVLVKALRKIAETYIDTAEDEALDKLAYDHFSLERQAAVKAVGTLTFTRDDTDEGDITIPIGARFATNPGGSDPEIVFETAETVTLTGTTINASAQAVVGGISGSVEADSITVIKTQLDDSTITVNNDGNFTGGQEKEGNPEFRDRIKKYLLTLRRATPAAVEFGAEQVGGVVFANLDESTAGDGYITLFIADADGNSNAELEAAVAAEIVNWRAAGVTVNIDSASVVTQAITFANTYEAGVDTEAVRLASVAAAKGYRDGLNVGETLKISLLYQAIQSVDGLKSTVVAIPSGDVVPDPDEIFRGGTITGT